MKLISSSINHSIDKASFFLPEINYEEEHNENDMRVSCVSLSNSLNKIAQASTSRNKSADIIKRFLKKVIAAQSYSKMFSEGNRFKELNIGLDKPLTGKSSLHSLQHFNNLSSHYLAKIKENTQNLTSQEKDLLSKVVDAKIHFRHQSNSNLAAKNLNIMSFHKLQSEGVSTAKKTYMDDIECLANHDFVFFGVEFSGDKENLPLNTIHSTVDFGANAYIVDDQFPHGYLTLTDHFFNTVPNGNKQEHQNFVTQFTVLKNEIFRTIYEGENCNNVPVYNNKDMRLGLGLHLINFLRKSNDEEFKRFVFNENLDNKDLDKVINTVFQPEFHVPRMVSLTNFKEVKLREISLVEAVKASNIDALSARIKNKESACEAMMLAIENSKKDIVDFLFSKFTFTYEELLKIPFHYDLEYILSESSSNEKILLEFLKRGLIDPNKAFRKVNTGDTMLDNARKYKHQAIIDILTEYGAVSGKEMNKKKLK